ncbi:MAG TPA: hypothetical protein VFT82_00535 [Candidatus Paceibacterota bacterium]|nr:hypothetical protein [Candidatus Paceibacterota bacterium]
MKFIPGMPIVKQGFVGLDIHFALTLPPRLRIFGSRFTRKGEFHVTLVSGDVVTEEVRVAAEKAAKGIRFRIGVEPSFFLVEKDYGIESRRSIIASCLVAGAEEFNNRLYAQTGVIIDSVPYHVTLYTAGNSKGIGLTSQQDKLRFATKIPYGQVPKAIKIF